MDGGYTWCLTRNLGGFHVDVAASGMYPVLTEGLARFHHALGLFSEASANGCARWYLCEGSAEYRQTVAGNIRRIYGLPS